MKQVLLLLLCTGFGHYGIAQAPTRQTDQEICKPEKPLRLVYEFKGFNFNDAVRCERGFRVSLSGRKWRACSEADSNCNACCAAIISNNRVRVIIELYEKYSLLHFPLALTRHPGYAAKDSALLILERNVELERNTEKVVLLAGDYPVNIVNNELVIEIALAPAMHSCYQ